MGLDQGLGGFSLLALLFGMDLLLGGLEQRRNQGEVQQVGGEVAQVLALVVGFAAVDLELAFDFGGGFADSAAFGFKLLAGGFGGGFGAGNLGLQALLLGGFLL